MSALDTLAPGFPHGTREGHAQGCKTSLCPGTEEFGFSCSQAAMWFAGDYSFRKRVLAGMSPADIFAETEAAKIADAAAAVVERAASKAAAIAAAKPVKQKRVPVVRSPKPEVVRIPVDKTPKHGTVAMYRAGCFTEVGCPSRPSCATVNLAHVLGEELHIDERVPAERARRRPRSSSGVRNPIHGTEYGRQMGCKTIEDCPNGVLGLETCVEYSRRYHREYAAARKAGEGPREHGTASGYAMGCKDRSKCKSALAGGISCADASLATERERRRRRGIPARELVDATPVRAHVIELHKTMSYKRIGELAGVRGQDVRRLAVGRDDKNRRGELAEHTDRAKAEKLLAVRSTQK